VKVIIYHYLQLLYFISFNFSPTWQRFKNTDCKVTIERTLPTWLLYIRSVKKWSDCTILREKK